MTADEMDHWLHGLTSAEREQVFRRLRSEFLIHPIERDLHTSAEIILEAIHKRAELTLRMIRGVIAEEAFRAEVIADLKGWKEVPSAGGLSYDYLLKDRKGEVRVQVKLQRSEAGEPKKRQGMFVVETQKTRGGTNRRSQEKTRPYRFDEFDVLAVAMYPSTDRWDKFMYTVANWLLPSQEDASQIATLQPIPPEPNKDWTDDFNTVARWLRSKTKKTINSPWPQARRRRSI
jgi:hypothetical protein